MIDKSNILWYYADQVCAVTCFKIYVYLLEAEDCPNGINVVSGIRKAVWERQLNVQWVVVYYFFYFILALTKSAWGQLCLVAAFNQDINNLVIPKVLKIVSENYLRSV
jgi:hypothetical protein